MKNTIPRLKKNAKVRIIAPGAASPLQPNTPPTHWEDLEKACELLRSWDLTPVYSPQIFAEHSSFYNFANTDAARYADFIDAFSSDATAIWTFRGGYGSDRIIQAAIKNNFTPVDTKLFIGFSDVTNLHSYMHSHWHWPTLHALTTRQLGLQLVDAADVTMTREILFGETNQVQLTLKPLNSAATKAKEIHGKITGGNLTMVQTALGTPWQPMIKNNILLLEDIGEAPYRIARIFQQFLASGVVESTQAVILGDFIPDAGMDLVIAEFADQCKVPVLRCAGIGHGKNNHPVPLGTDARLVMGDAAELTVAAL